MGATNSRIEEDKALTLCRERKRLVRQALDERCSLAAAHVSYIRSLRETGIALREFVETEAPNESSLFTPTSATPEPLALTDTPKHIVSQTDEIPSSETPPTHSGTTWDFFAPSHPIDNQLSFQNGRGLNRGFDNADEIRRLREEEGIPELEEDGDRASTNEENDLDSEDDFDHPSSEPLVQMFENRNLISEHLLKSESAAIQSEKDIVSETKHQNGDDMKLTNDISETTDEMTPTKAASYIVAISMNGKGKETDPETKNEARDPLSCMLEIADLFLKASESGKEIPMMLEANKVQFRPLFAEEKGNTIVNFIEFLLTIAREKDPTKGYAAD